MLTACQTLPPAPAPSAEVPATASRHFQVVHQVQQFQVQAKLAVQWSGKGYTARMRWQHLAPQQDDMAIFSPLGQQVARIQRDSQQVSLTDQQGHLHQAQDVGSLTEHLLGWRLPLQGLQYWMLGAPDPRSTFQASYNNDGQLRQLQQDGWQIDYAPFATTTHAASQRPISMTPWPDALPTELRLSQGEIRLKLVVQEWAATALPADSAIK